MTTIKIYIEEQYQLSVEFQKKARKQHRQVYDLYRNRVGQIRNQGNLHDVAKEVTAIFINGILKK